MLKDCSKIVGYPRLSVGKAGIPSVPCVKGKGIRIINRWEATSQVCSKCGWHWGKLDLSTRVIVCGATRSRKS